MHLDPALKKENTYGVREKQYIIKIELPRTDQPMRHFKDSTTQRKRKRERKIKKGKMQQTGIKDFPADNCRQVHIHVASKVLLPRH